MCWYLLGVHCCFTQNGNSEMQLIKQLLTSPNFKRAVVTISYIVILSFPGIFKKRTDNKPKIRRFSGSRLSLAHFRVITT